MGTSELNAGGNPAMDQQLIKGVVNILPVASCYRNRDKLRSDGPLGSYADLTFYLCRYVRSLCCYVACVNEVHAVESNTVVHE